MTFQYRIQTYKDEEGEYSEYKETSIAEILDIIDRHWTGEQMPNHLKIISIKNSDNENLMLVHDDKYVFESYFLPRENNCYYRRKSEIEVIYDSLELFFANDIPGVLDYLIKRKEEVEFIRGDFFYKNHDYELSKKNNLSLFIWYAFGALAHGGIYTLIGLSLLTMPFHHYYLPVFFLLIGTYFWLPGILFHRQYMKDAEGLTIRVTKGSESIVASSLDNETIFAKSDIKSVIKYENPAYKIPWSEYGYTEVVFMDGSILNLTNLLVDQSCVLNKFKSSYCQTKKSKWPKLKKSTVIKPC